MEYLEHLRTTALLELRVARAGRAALIPVRHAPVRSIRKRVSAVALVAELDPRIREALTSAEPRTVVGSHIRRCRRRPSQHTPVRALRNAADVRPPRCERRNRVEEAGGGQIMAARSRREICPHGVAPRKRRNLVTQSDILVHNLGIQRACRRRILVDVRNQNLTQSDVTVHVVAVVDRVLQHRLVPPHQEVRMVRQTSRVAGRDHVGSLAPVVKVADRDDLLVEDRDGVDRVRLGAVAAVIGVDRVSHVRRVVGAIEVDTIPALGEEYLEADAVLTHVDVGEVDVLALGVCGVVGDCSAVVEADEADCLVGEVGCVVCVARRASSNHLELGVNIMSTPCKDRI